MFVNPDVCVRGNLIHARTSLLERVVFLWSFDKTVEIDRTQRVIRIASRSFWFVNSTKDIPFSRIRSVETKASSEQDKMGRERLTYSIVLLLEDPREKFTLINFKDGLTSAETAFQEYFDLLNASLKQNLRRR